MCLVKNQEDTFVKLHSALYQRAGKCRDELVYLSRYKLKPCKRVCCVCVRVCVCVCVCVCVLGSGNGWMLGFYVQKGMVQLLLGVL